MTGHSRNVRIIVIAGEHLEVLMRGQGKVANMPADGVVIAQFPVGNRLGVRVNSSKYSAVEHGFPIPCITAVIERKDEKVSA